MHRPVKEWFENEYLNNQTHKALKTSVVGNTIFSAVQNLESKKVFATIFKFSFNNRDTYNFSYKGMDETVGPNECNCPKSILKLLSPTDCKFSLDWRQSVLEYHKSKSQERKAIKNGWFFKLDEALKFNDGMTYQYFKKNGKDVYAYRLEEGVIKRIRVSLKLNNYKHSIQKEISC